MNNDITSIDQYISNYPKEVQVILGKIRQTIHMVAPEAKEKIGYGIPTFTLKGNLVHFGAYPTHIGFYPSPPIIVAYKDKLKNYNTSKGTVQFPLDQPIPYELIKGMTLARVQATQKTNR